MYCPPTYSNTQSGHWALNTKKQGRVYTPTPGLRPSARRRGGTDVDSRLSKDRASGLRIEANMANALGSHESVMRTPARPLSSCSARRTATGTPKHSFPGTGWRGEKMSDGQARMHPGSTPTEAPDSQRSTDTGELHRFAKGSGHAVPQHAHLMASGSGVDGAAFLQGRGSIEHFLERWGPTEESEKSRPFSAPPKQRFCVPVSPELLRTGGATLSNAMLREMDCRDAPEGNPGNYLSLQLGSATQNPSVWQGDARTKYFPVLRGGMPLPYSVHRPSDGAERTGPFSSHASSNPLPGATKLNREMQANPFMPDSPFKSTITDVTRWTMLDRQNKVPLNPAGYKKKYCEAVQHHERLASSSFGCLSRGHW